MTSEPEASTVDVLVLRFDGEENDGSTIHELHAAHVADVLQGVVGLATDFAKAGAFGDGPAGSEVLVRPPHEGSFLIEVLRFIQDNEGALAAGMTATGLPTLSQVIWWATRSSRADVSDFEYLENGNVKVSWQDKTADEIPIPAWEELQKRKRRRKKQLRQIMSPLSDNRVTSVAVEVPASAETPDAAVPEDTSFTLTRADYDAVKPDDDVEETQVVFDAEAQMSAIDFDDPSRWRVKTQDSTRAATVQDDDFLGRVANGLAIRKTDIFRLRVREDTVKKNGRSRSRWTVLKVESFRRASRDDDA